MPATSALNPAASAVPQGPQSLTVPELNQLVLTSPDIQEKLNAMEGLAMRDNVDVDTFRALKQQVARNTSSLSGVERMNAVDAKRGAILALNILNGRLGEGVPTTQLPGFAEMQRIIADRDESPEVKKAVLHGLRVLNRSGDPNIQKLAQQALRSSDAQTKQLAQLLLNSSN